MEKKIKMRVFDDGKLILRWLISEKQMKIIQALVEVGIFFDEVRFEFEEDTDVYKDLTWQSRINVI